MLVLCEAHFIVFLAFTQLPFVEYLLVEGPVLGVIGYSNLSKKKVSATCNMVFPPNTKWSQPLSLPKLKKKSLGIQAHVKCSHLPKTAEGQVGTLPFWPS